MKTISILAAGLVLALSAAVPVVAQAQTAEGLSNRLDRLERALQTLERQVYRGGPPPVAAAPSAGAPLSGTAGDGRFRADLEVRLTQLETEIRNLTGRTEEMSHGVSQLTARLDRLVSDIDQRLRALEGGAPAPQATPQATPQSAPQLAPRAGGTAQGAPPVLAAPVREPRPLQPPSALVMPSDPVAPGAPPTVLGTVPRDSVGDNPPPEPVAPPPAQAAATPGTLPSGSARQQYDYAFALIRDQKFAEAEQAMRAFIDAHPKDGLTPNAYYWLGRTYFARRDFGQASYAFAEALQRFPNADKAPDALYSLSASQAQLGKTQEACTFYKRLIEGYPQAPASLKERATRDRQQLKCR